MHSYHGYQSCCFRVQRDTSVSAAGPPIFGKKPEVSCTHGNAMTQSAQPNTPQDQKIVSLGIKAIITALCTQSLKYSEIFKLNSVSIKLFSLQNLRFFNKSSKVCILTAAAILESLAGPKSCWLHWYPLLSSFALQNTENTPAMHAINY